MYPKKQSPSTCSSRGEDLDGIRPIQPPRRHMSNREKHQDKNETKQTPSSSHPTQKQDNTKSDHGENMATKVAHGSSPIDFEPVHPPKQSYASPPPKQKQEDTKSDQKQSHDAPGAFAVQGQQIEHQHPGVISPHEEVPEPIDEANVTNLQNLTVASVAVDMPVAAELSPEPKSLETEILRILDERAVVPDKDVPQGSIPDVPEAFVNHPHMRACNKNRRLCFVVALIMAVVVAIGLIVKVATDSSGGSTESKEFEELQAFLADASFDSGEAIYDKDTPQYQAAMWLSNSRSCLDDCRDYEKIQLYVLATLSYSTGGNTWIDDGSNACGWKPTVECNSSDIIKINLANYNLQGTIPPELGLLSDSLLELFLRGNKLTGSCPPELGELTKVERLQLTNNRLTESIPTELGKLLNLRELGLGINQFIGEIPKELGDLPSIITIGLERNQLSGNIPVELGQLQTMKNLFLDMNKLSGSCPPELGELAKLEKLQLTNNSLTESIPTELGKLLKLKDLGLGVNKFTGKIPKELGDLSSIITIGLERNQLSGNIPVELGQLQTIENLYFDYNNLSGTIPTELSDLTKLKVIAFDNNDITGSVPISICELPDLQQVRIDCDEITYCDCCARCQT